MAVVILLLLRAVQRELSASIVNGDSKKLGTVKAHEQLSRTKLTSRNNKSVSAGRFTSVPLHALKQDYHIHRLHSGSVSFKGAFMGPTNKFRLSRISGIINKNGFFLPYSYEKISNMSHCVQAAELMLHCLIQFAEILEISKV